MAKYQKMTVSAQNKAWGFNYGMTMYIEARRKKKPKRKKSLSRTVEEPK